MLFTTAMYILPQILDRAVQEQPEKVAFKYMQNGVTFSELQKRATKLALVLTEHGLKKGDRIGIYMPRCLESAIAVYGVLKAGGVYVPLDPFAPQQRTEFVIKDCTINYIVTIPQQKRKLKKIALNTALKSVIGLDELEVPLTKVISWEDVFRHNEEEFKPVNILGDDLAYILYTSGSTGKPKGIMHTHTSALAFVRLVSDLYQMQNEIYGMHAPLHFDPSVQGFFAAPYALATTIIVSDAHTKMPSSLAQLIEQEQITIWFSVPLALMQLLSHGDLDKKNMTALKWVLFSGEVFPTKHLRSLMEKWPFARFSNIYGPTETNQCTFYHVGDIPKTNKPIPIGSIWGDTEFKILNDKEEEVPKGEIGELVVRTATMMKGYWNNKALTQESLFKDETIPGFEKLYYKTGDQVRLDEEGQLLFFGRNDHQIKIRGYRVELEEINNVFTALDEVDEAVTIVLEDKDNYDKKLTAVLLPKQHHTLDLQGIKSYAKTQLPPYAVPTSIHVYSEFPRTATGKIDRKKIEKHMTSL